MGNGGSLTAAVQNIGAYGAEVSQVIERVRVYDFIKKEIRELTTNEMQYAYRYSTLKEPNHRNFLVTAVYVRLHKDPRPNLQYAGLHDLQEQSTLTPAMIAERVVSIRESKLPDPTVLPNAGSFFMNPILDRATFESLQAKYPNVPYYSVGECFKVPAAWLIQEVQMKGVRSGDVGTYPKQPLVLVNYGTTVGRHIADFAGIIQAKVQERFGISLQPEVRYVISAEQPTMDQLKSNLIEE